MTTVINGSSPSITFSDSTTQSTAGLTSSSSLNATNLTSGTVPAARLPAGSVLQVTQYVNTTQYSGSGTATIFSTTFTPTSATSKVLLIVSIAMGAWNPNGGIQIIRNGTSVQDAGGTYGGGAGYYSSDEFIASAGSYALYPFTVIYLDSPGTTSAITYGIKANGTTAYYVNQPAVGASSGYGTTTIQFLEIAA